MLSALNKTRSEIVSEIDTYVNNALDAERIFNLLDDNKGCLSTGEYIKKVQSSNPSCGSYGFVGFGGVEYKYSINLKLSSVLLAATILGVAVTPGALNAILALKGSNGSAALKLQDEQKCVVGDIAIITKCMKHNLYHAGTKCHRPALKCKNKPAGKCERNEDETDRIINDLIAQRIVDEKSGILNLVF